MMNKQIVAVKFRIERNNEEIYGGREYHFFSLEDVYPGDIVVVNTVNGLRLASVSRLVDHSSEKSYANKWIVQKVDKEKYLEKVKEEERISDLKARLNVELSKKNEKEHYQSILDSPESSENAKELARQILELS